MFHFHTATAAACVHGTTGVLAVVRYLGLEGVQWGDDNQTLVITNANYGTGTINPPASSVRQHVPPAEQCCCTATVPAHMSCALG